MHSILTSQYVTVTELKSNPGKIIENMNEHQEAVAVLSHNKAKLYLLSPEEYKAYLHLKETLHVQSIQQGLAEAHSGQLISHDEVTKKWRQKYADTLDGRGKQKS